MPVEGSCYTPHPRSTTVALTKSLYNGNTLASCRSCVYSHFSMEFERYKLIYRSFIIGTAKQFSFEKGKDDLFTLTAILTFSRYEIYQDEVKPGGLNLNFLREFMDLPQSYLAPGAAIKFRKFFMVVMRTLLTYSITNKTLKLVVYIGKRSAASGVYVEDVFMSLRDEST